MKPIMQAGSILLFSLCVLGTLGAGEVAKKNGRLPCLSGVCLGDDVAGLKVNWLDYQQLGSLDKLYYEPMGEDEALAKQFFKNNVVGLDTGEVKTLTPYFARKAFDKRALQILRSKRPVFCSGWPLEGGFLSESGHLTKVRGVQDTDQKLKVVSIERSYKGLNEIQGEALWKRLAKEYPETRYGADNLVQWGHDSGNYVVTFRHPVWTVANKEYFDRWGDSFSEIRKLYQQNPERTADKNDFDYVLSKNLRCREHIAID
jgi:hypothetical protein